MKIVIKILPYDIISGYSPRCLYWDLGREGVGGAVDTTPQFSNLGLEK